MIGNFIFHFRYYFEGPKDLFWYKSDNIFSKHMPKYYSSQATEPGWVNKVIQN